MNSARSGVHDASDVDRSFDLPLVLLVCGLEELEHGLNDGSLVVEAHADATIAEWKMVAGIEDHQALKQADHRATNSKVLEVVRDDEIIEGVCAERCGPVEVRQEVHSRPGNHSITAFLSLYELVELREIAREQSDALDVRREHDWTDWLT